MRTIVLGVAVAAMCAGACAPASKGAGGTARRPGGGKDVELADPDAGAALLAHERAVWTLEGLLVAEADAAMRSPDAQTALGDPAAAARSGKIERPARDFLRAHRSTRLRRLATIVVAGLDDATRERLDAAAGVSGLDAEDVFLDYLTYDGLYDLAIMRHGWKRWQSGRYSGDAKALADSFFSLVPEIPSAAKGIDVRAGDEKSIEISVFGGRVVETIDAVELGDGSAEVTWSSNYERLRAGLRGQDAPAATHEKLQLAGSWLVSYRVELDEYLAINATNPWATMLYLMPADELADLYAGVAAGGGLESGSVLGARDAGELPDSGVIGTAEHGLSVRVAGASDHDALGEAKPRRGKFLVVTIEVRSTLGEDLRAPAEWFTVATGEAEYPELGVAWPGLALVVLPGAPVGADMLALPYTTLAAGKTELLVLIYDVPANFATGALVFGADELALKVAPR